MRQLLAFGRKEWMELVRTGKLWILLAVFFLFGVMNPAIAKLIPWMLETLADSLQETGLMVQEVEVNAMTSWTQFYKNVPLALIIFVVMSGTILTAEYQRGTLICVLTRGMDRWKVLAAKGFVMLGTWTICYFLCFGVTCWYNAYFWGNEGIPSVFFGAGCVYLFGVWCLAILLFWSALLKTGTSVLLSVGGVYLICYLSSLIPGIKFYLPMWLMSAGQLLNGMGGAEDFGKAIIVTCVSAIAVMAAAVVIFDKREI